MLIGPITVAGTTAAGRINLATLLPGVVESDLADGLLFRSADQNTRMFVTTRGLFAAWIADRFTNDRNIPRDPQSALTREEVYTAIFGDDAAVQRYADLPVTAPGKHVVAAMLVDRAQDYCLTCVPGTILVGASAGDRIFVVDAPVRETIPIPPQCGDSAAEDSRGEDEQFAALRRCYGDSVRSDPRFERIVGQTRSLVERLPDR